MALGKEDRGTPMASQTKKTDESSDRPARKRRFNAGSFIPLFLIGAGLYAYHKSLHYPFVYDDLPSITENLSIRHVWALLDVLSPPAETPVTGRPLVNLSLAVNYAFGGLNVWGYHVFNLIVHLLAALVLYGVVRRTLLGVGLRERYGDAAPWLALTLALMWVVHPLQTESVTYTVQRTESLMGLFFLLTLYCVIRGSESSQPPGWYAAAVVSSMLGMCSKEVMAVAPVVVLAYDRLFLSRSLKEALLRRWTLYVGLAATWLIFSALVQTRMRQEMALLNLADVTGWDYAKTQASVILHYLRLAFLPSPLVGDYGDYEGWPLAGSMATMLPAAVVTMLVGVTGWALHRRLPVSFLGVWFFLILAPTSSFWPIPTEVAAERRMYLPLAAVIALVVIGGHTLLRDIWRRLAWRTPARHLVEAALLVVIVTTLARITMQRNEDYRSPVSFWSDVVAKRPHNARGHNNLGVYLYTEGSLGEAARHFSEALRLKPGHYNAHNNLGRVLAAQGKLPEAIGHYSEALRINPNYAEARNNLEAARAMLGGVIAQYAGALRLSPNNVEAHYNLGNALAAEGKLEEAIIQYSAALEIDPSNAPAHRNLGVALVRQGKLEEGIAHLAEALRIAPSAQAHYNLASALARNGSTQEARGHLELALELDPAYEPARRALKDLTYPAKK